jgi:murein L,D-transpeptidase YafK
MRSWLRRIVQGAALFLVAAVLLFRFWPHQALPAGAKADAILVVKSERTLSLLRNKEVISTYRVALGGNPTGHKVREGDGRTPEGRYVIAGRNRNSGFYRALRVSYPNARDKEHARALGVSAGGDIMVHGVKNGFGWLGRLHRLVDWTDGCIAVTDEEMRDIWNATRDGVPIEIRP